MLKALQASYPNRFRYTVLEDNNPAGFRSKQGMAAKKRAHIDTLEIPKHSPQLSVCDYWLWNVVNNAMLLQERY